MRRIILEEWEYALQAKTPEDVEPVLDAWAGGDNLINPLDHSKAGGSESVTDEQETLDLVGEVTRVNSRGRLRHVVITTLLESKILLELKGDVDDFSNPFGLGKFGWSIVKDVAGDVVADIAGAIPVVGDAAVGVSVAFNVWQLHRDMRRSEEHILEFVEATDEEEQTKSLDDLAADLEALNVNMWDFFQRVLAMVPMPGGELASAASTIQQTKRALSQIKAWKAVQATGAAGARAQVGTGFKSYLRHKAGKGWARVKVAAFSQPLTEMFTEIMDHPDTPDSARGYLRQIMGFILGIPERMILIQDLFEDFEDQQDEARQTGKPFKYVLTVELPSDISPTMAYAQDPRSRAPSGVKAVAMRRHWWRGQRRTLQPSLAVSGNFQAEEFSSHLKADDQERKHISLSS